MSPRVSISLKAARALALQAGGIRGYGAGAAVDEIIAALAKLERSKVRRAPRRAKSRETKASKRLDPRVYREAAKRAGNKCEACGLDWGFGPAEVPEFDHLFLRANAHSVDTVWRIHKSCHDERHASNPTRAFWLKRALDWCDRHQYGETARELAKDLAYENVRTSLPASPGVRP
jgi:hypothetical protein